MARVLILDASAFIMGYEASSNKVKHYTVPSVLKEIRQDLHKIRLESAISGGSITVVTPKRDSIIKVQKIVSMLGELGALSDVDIELLALGLQFKQSDLEPTIVSDDYSIQNVASSMGILFKGLGTSGITKIFEWVTYCPGCRKRYDKPQSDGICPICGTDLKRKPVKKKVLNSS
jgi:UPF0271 protein